MKSIEWNTSDKVQMAENTTGTTTSTTYTLGELIISSRKRLGVSAVRPHQCPLGKTMRLHQK